MRYFRASDIFGAKVYLEGWRAPGHISLLNEFQKWSKSVPLTGQKLFSGQSTTRSSRVILSPSYARWFSSSIDLVAWPSQREDSCEEFQNKDLRKKRRFLHCYFLLREKLVDKLTYYFSSIVAQLLKRSTICQSPLHGPRNYVIDRMWERSRCTHLLASFRAELQLWFVFCTMDPQCEVDSCKLCGLIFLYKDTKHCRGISKNSWDSGRFEDW